MMQTVRRRSVDVIVTFFRMKRLLLNALETNTKIVNVYFFKRIYFGFAIILPERVVWNAPQLMDEIVEKNSCRKQCYQIVGG